MMGVLPHVGRYNHYAGMQCIRLLGSLVLHSQSAPHTSSRLPLLNPYQLDSRETSLISVTNSVACHYKPI